MRFATWNVNSVRARLDVVKTWLEGTQPDLVVLQEIKAQIETFPFADFKALGYEAQIVGQKSYNGVAVLSRAPVELVLDHLPDYGMGEGPNPGEADQQARYLEVKAQNCHFACIYLPNGNPINTDKFPYKLRWMQRLQKRAEELLAQEQAFVLAGDFNVCPLDKDCHNPKALANDALLQRESRDLWHGLLHLGLTDAFRTFNQQGSAYSYWDYTGGAYDKDHGLRIDHILLSPQMADRLLDCHIDRTPRAQPKASDHTPVVCTLQQAEQPSVFH